jgi:hypothetical protein
MTYKGKFTPRNPQKYRGNPTNIIYRSSWEARAMRYFDMTDNVLEWQSEELAIPYKSPIDGKWHRYFPDFIIKVKDKNSITKTLMIEIKPNHQTKQPIPKKIGQRTTKKYLNEVVTYAINSRKWEAAQEYCKDRKWEFVILTEKELNL